MMSRRKRLRDRADVVRMPQRRIDDRLNTLCVRALTAADSELEAIRRELLTLVNQKIERLPARTASHVAMEH